MTTITINIKAPSIPYLAPRKGGRTMLTPCPSCGLPVRSDDWLSHPTGPHCKALTRAKKLYAEGYRMVHHNIAKALQSRPNLCRLYSPRLELTAVHGLIRKTQGWVKADPDKLKATIIAHRTYDAMELWAKFILYNWEDETVD